MRAKPLIFTLFLLVVVTIYSIYWFKVADRVQAQFEQRVAEQNAAVRALDKDVTLLRYTGMHVSGYPFKVTLTLKGVVLQVPASAFLKPLAAPDAPQAIAQPPAAPAPLWPAPRWPAPRWIEEASLNGELSASVSMFTRKVRTTLRGDLVEKTLVNGALTRTLTHHFGAPLVCHVFTPHGAMPNLQDSDMLLHTLGSLACEVRDLSVEDTASHATLYHADKIEAAYNNVLGAEPNRLVKLHFLMDKAAATPAFDKVVEDYTQLFYQALNVPPAARNPSMPASRYGEQTMALDANYDGPIDASALTEPAARLTFDLTRFTDKNATGEGSADAHVTSLPDKANAARRTISVTWHSKATIAPAADGIFAEQLATIFAAVVQNPDKTPTQTMAAQTLSTLGTPQAIAAALTPKLSGFGTIASDIDVALTGDNKKDAFMQHSVLQVNNATLLATPYGLTLKGGWNREAPAATAADATLVCQRCDAFISDAGAYAMRVEQLLNRLHPEKPLVVTQALIESARQFLHQLADAPADAKTNATPTDASLSFHLVLKPSGDFTISGKPLLQVIGLFGTIMGPQLQHIGAATAPVMPMPVMSGPPAMTPGAAPATPPSH